MNNPKQGRPPKGEKALTGAERQKRYKQRGKIVSNELIKTGLEPITLYLPKGYVKALRAFEEIFDGTYEKVFDGKNDAIQTSIKTSSWAAVAIGEFLQLQAKEYPDTELEKMVNKNELIGKEIQQYHEGMLNARAKVLEYDKQHEENKK